MYDQESEDTEGGSDDDFTSFARTVFDSTASFDDRAEALKQCIRICSEEDEEGEYDDAEEGDEEKPKPGSLALIFGAKPKKK